MLLPLCSHQPSFPPQTIPSPSPPIPSSFSFFPVSLSQSPKLLPKFLLRRTSAAATSTTTADTRTLSKSAIQRIADKLRSLGYVDKDKEDPGETPNLNTNSSATSPGQIFVPLPKQIPKHRVGHTLDTSWSTPENPVPEPGTGNAIQRFHGLLRGVLKEKKEERVKRRGEGREEVPSLAELTLPEDELRRLKSIGIELKKKLKIGRPGITEGIVNGIHERWRRSEVVKIKCEDFCKMNMKRTHDLLERKTGGLVIWRSGSIIILYRGADYKYPYFFSDNNSTNNTSDDGSPDLYKDRVVHDGKESCSSGMNGMKFTGPNTYKTVAHPPLVQGIGSPNRVRFQLSGEAQLSEEADRLLEGLGPRFIDWWGYDPLPVDADLLPAIVPGYRRPFRLLPYGVKPKLTNDEMTILRRLGRPLPCHFALGRNRKLQGLSASVVKLWEKCEIAKIAVKRGVQNTKSELMAEGLKFLTGGILLSRDREFIVLYRGKDFLPTAVSSAIEERRKYVIHGEENRTDCNLSITDTQEHKLETMECASEEENDEANDQKEKDLTKQRKLRSAEAAIRRTSTKLSMAVSKKTRAEELLEELEKEESRQQPAIDKEGITEEERYMLRKVGLRMKPFLLLGRRGVFDGTVENMHLHWKYRELVKIICGERSVEEVHGIARTLEAESGGILVAVERVSRVYAIIVYRGKNYTRPSCLRPQTLLSKREAMKRSKEAQRRESLKLNVLKLSRNIDDLKLELAKDKETNNMQLAKESKHESVKEQETNQIQPTVYRRSYTDLDTNYHSCSVSPACDQLDAEAGEKHGADSTSIDLDAVMDASSDTIQTTRQEILRVFSLKHDVKDEGEFNVTGPWPLSVSVGKETSSITDMCGEGGDVESTTCQDILRDFSLKHDVKVEDEFNVTEPGALSVSVKETSIITDMCGEGGDVESTTRPDDFMSQGHTSFPAIFNAEPHINDIKNMETSVDSSKNELQPSIERALENVSNGTPFRAARLSNKERLLLRRQALRMRKRPVLAVGKNNNVTGVAKTIKTHFQKHPLAIVNIKGRAEGTSVQELVLKLEQATGAVLVSQEPSKVILYRGWGAEEEVGQTNKNTKYLRNTPARREGATRPLISPELMSAIKLECGLQFNP